MFIRNFSIFLCNMLYRILRIYIFSFMYVQLSETLNTNEPNTEQYKHPYRH